MENKNKLLALRIYNKTRSCLLMRKFPNGVWTLPVKTIDDQDDPADHIASMLQEIDGDFKLVAAVSILDIMSEDEKTGEVRSVVYDVKYDGRISASISARESKYVHGQWVPADGVRHKADGKLNSATTNYIRAVEVEQCLR